MDNSEQGLNDSKILISVILVANKVCPDLQVTLLKDAVKSPISASETMYRCYT